MHTLFCSGRFGPFSSALEPAFFFLKKSVQKNASPYLFCTKKCVLPIKCSLPNVHLITPYVLKSQKPTFLWSDTEICRCFCFWVIFDHENPKITGMHTRFDVVFHWEISQKPSQNTFSALRPGFWSCKNNKNKKTRSEVFKVFSRTEKPSSQKILLKTGQNAPAHSDHTLVFSWIWVCDIFVSFLWQNMCKKKPLISIHYFAHLFFRYWEALPKWVQKCVFCQNLEKPVFLKTNVLMDFGQNPYFYEHPFFEQNTNAKDELILFWQKAPTKNTQKTKRNFKISPVPLQAVVFWRKPRK